MCRILRPTCVGLLSGILLSLNPAATFAGSSELTPVPFQAVHVDDAFWTPRIKTNQTATIEANLHQCEITGRIRNFAIAGKLEKGKHEGALYNDSDVYKMIEGIAYALASKRDPDLEKRTDAIIDKIAAAQQPDGYLNTYYTLAEPDKRWKNIQYGHEMYCAGHLIEAAVAYYQATTKRKLLDVACRLADHIDTVFGPDKRHDVCGHEEIELALIKLYRATGRENYVKLARFFLDTRGRGDARKLFGDYCQDHKPIREQREVVGHAVRAMYLYSAMADMAAITGDKGLLQALDAIWHDVVDRKMYVTGGIGPSARNEGFTVAYDLPNDTAYAETCAAIGMALWNHRMFLMTGDGKYADVLERVVYNGLLSGVSLSGDKFFYVNPLGSKGAHHRVPWFDCSCCPTNIVRYIPAMGERAYAHRDNDIWTVLYMSNDVTIPLKGGKVKITQKTNYPWDGTISITVEPEEPLDFTLHLRIPAWCSASYSVVSHSDGRSNLDMSRKPEHGYLAIKGRWGSPTVIRLDLLMPVRRVYADEHVSADADRVALQRGPLVYCLEGVDNGGQVRNLCLPATGHSVDLNITPVRKPSLLGGVTVLQGRALAVSRDDNGDFSTKPVKFRAVPYYSWDNRQPGQMVVWLPEKPELAELLGEDGVLVDGIRARASHLFAHDTLTALHDTVAPKGSNDHDIPRMTWWDHKGSTEWVSYRFPKEREVRAADIYWFDDTGRGSCRVPAEWRLLWLDGKEWKPVKLEGGTTYGLHLDRFNKVTFEPVKTREVKVEVKLKENFSGGILKWHVR